MPGAARSAKLMPVPNAPSSLRILSISIARGLLRDGHDVTVFEQRPDVAAGGGAVTIWSNGATVLGQLGVDMEGAGQLLSTVRVLTSTGRQRQREWIDRYRAASSRYTATGISAGRAAAIALSRGKL